MKNRRTKLSIYLSKETITKIKMVALEKGRSVSGLIGQQIDEVIKKHKAEKSLPWYTPNQSSLLESYKQTIAGLENFIKAIKSEIKETPEMANIYREMLKSKSAELKLYKKRLEMEMKHES